MGALAVTVWIELTPLSDCIMPPFTSKVTRTAFSKLWGVEPKMPKRRASFSLLFRDGKPLYRILGGRSVGEARSLKLMARRGERLHCRCSLITSQMLLPEPVKVVKVGAAEFKARVSNIEVVEVSELRAIVPRKFTLRFQTPTLLPVPGRGRFLKEAGVKRRYKLVPDLPLALKLLAYDLKLQGIDVIRSSPRRIFAWAYRALAELDYRVRPVTVLYTFREERPAVERGFISYVSYELLNSKSD